MNARKKETDEINQMTESLSNNKPTKARSKSLSRNIKPILITILAVLCLTGGIVLHKIHAFEKQYTNQKTNHIYKKEKKPQLNLSQNQNTHKQIKLFDQTPSPIENTPLAIDQKSDKNLLTTKTSTEDQHIETKTSETPLINLNEETKNAQLIGFSLADALLFKEHFLTEESCYEDYQKLLNASNKSNLENDVLNNLSPYCLSNQSAIKNVQDAFLKNKKKALIVYYKENNPSWIAYLKAIPASLIEIRKINPTENTPKDILYKAQNEIDSQNISKSIDLITKLPLSMQQKMTDFYREAAIYNRAKNSIDQLILSFEVKGE